MASERSVEGPNHHRPSSPRQIIGVVGDVRDDALNRNPRPNLYELSAQMTSTGMMATVPWAWAIRTRAAPMSLSAAIQEELREASGGLPVARVRTMEETLSRSTAAENFNTLVLTMFGCAALLLAAIGIYGLMAYSVGQRATKSASGWLWEQNRATSEAW